MTFKACLKSEVYFEYPNAIHQHFEDMIDANKCHETIALIYKDKGIPQRETKYKDLNHKGNQIANLFIDFIKMSSYQPNKDGDFVIAVIAKPSDTLIIVLLAILKTGAAYLSIDPKYPKSRIEFILNETKPILIVHDDDFLHTQLLDAYKSMKFTDILRESESMSGENLHDDKRFAENSYRQKLLISYTSGTTGVMKGARHDNFTLFQRIRWQVTAYPFPDTETHCVFKTSTSFIDHFGELWSPLVSGKTVVVVAQRILDDIEKFIWLLEEYEIQRLVLVPSFLHRILLTLKTIGEMPVKKEKKKRESIFSRASTSSSRKDSTSSSRNESLVKPKYLKNIRLWITSGETLSQNTVHEFFEYFNEDAGENVLVNCYGTTEALDCILYEFTSRKQLESLERIPIGVPVNNTIVYIMRRGTNDVLADEGESGEICIAGLTLCEGYVKNRSSQLFKRNKFDLEENYSRIFYTGDYGTIKNGIVYFDGREDNLIKVQGHRVDIEEISNVIKKLNYVLDFSIFAYHPSQPDQLILCFIELTNYNLKQKEVSDVINDISIHLVDYMIPKIFLLNKIPHLPSGKVDNDELTKFYEDTLPKKVVKIHIDYDIRDIPLSKVNKARKVFKAVGTSLGKDFHSRLSIQSNFFNLGGTSINLITTINELCKNDCNISINDFLKAKNLGEVIQSVNETEVDIIKHVALPRNFIFERMTGVNELEQADSKTMLSEVYGTKFILNQFFMDIKPENYLEVLNMHWKKFKDDNLSFYIKDTYDEILATTLLISINQRPESYPNNAVNPIFTFIDAIERPIIENQDVMNCLYVFMMGVSPKLQPNMIFNLIDFMESKIIEIAKENHFKGIFVTNFDSITQYLCQEVYGYEKKVQYVLNTFQYDDGRKPFATAPDNYIARIVYKEL